MADHDELLARADATRYRSDNDAKLIVDLAAALRAALAARPQPLFEGAIIDNGTASGGSPVVLIELDSPDPLRELDDLTGEQVVVYPAVAGSATPTGDDHE
jgi:hypothetical protein